MALKTKRSPNCLGPLDDSARPPGSGGSLGGESDARSNDLKLCFLAPLLATQNRGPPGLYYNSIGSFDSKVLLIQGFL